MVDLEKLPLLTLSAANAILTMRAQRTAVHNADYTLVCGWRMLSWPMRAMSATLSGRFTFLRRIRIPEVVSLCGKVLQRHISAADDHLTFISGKRYLQLAGCGSSVFLFR